MAEITILQRPTAVEVAKRWRQQYLYGGQWSALMNGASSQAVYKALRALPPDASRDQIDAVIGNDSWTSLNCSSCEDDAEQVWLVGDERSVYLCQGCITLAAKTLRRR